MNGLCHVDRSVSGVETSTPLILRCGFAEQKVLVKLYMTDYEDSMINLHFDTPSNY